MDWSNSSPFDVFKRKLAWLDQRQTVLAQNIANADTPRYHPKDLKAQSFDDLVNGASSLRGVQLATTDPRHLPPLRSPAAFAEQVSPTVSEATANGNAVTLEDEMAKLNETAMTHKLTSQLYRKYLGLVRMAASARA